MFARLSASLRREVFALFLGCCCLVLISASAIAQVGRTTLGTDFYVPLILPSSSCEQLDSLRSYSVLISAPTETSVQVTYFDDVTGTELLPTIYKIGAMRSIQITLDTELLRSAHPHGEYPEFRAVHLVCSSPVAAYLFAEGPVSCYESLLLPTPLLDTSYIVSTAPANPGVGMGMYEACGRDSSASLFTIVATKDSTVVLIAPATTTQSGIHAAGFAFNVTLQRGQVYSVKSGFAPNITMDNSSIVSNFPMAVWGAQEGAIIGGSDFADPNEEQRNMMAQQLLPSTLWGAEQGCIVPPPDPPGLSRADPGAGFELRLYAIDTPASVAIHSNDGVKSLVVDRSHSSAVEHLLSATTVESASRVAAMAFDYHAENQNYPVVMPTMFVALPEHAGTRACMVSIPRSTIAREQESFLSVIIPTSASLNVWIDGIGPMSLDSFRLSRDSLPGMLGYETRTYFVKPGKTYVLQCAQQFLAYQSNYFGVSIAGPVRHGDSHSIFYSSTSPVAAKFAPLRRTHTKVFVSMNCDASWSVKAISDSGTSLAYATILNDSLGILNSNTAWESTNISDANRLIQPGSVSATFRVFAQDPLSDADAYLDIVDYAGNDTVIHLHYDAPPVTASRTVARFSDAAIGLDTCVRIVYRIVDTAVGASPVVIESMSHQDSTFYIVAIPPLPVTLRNGDSLAVTICHVANIESRRDTLHLAMHSAEEPCTEARLPIESVSSPTTMYANDRNFGTAVIGSKNYNHIAVMNTGTADLLITRLTRTGSDAFVFLDSARLPLLLGPQESRELAFYYRPEIDTPGSVYDTAIFHWSGNATATKLDSKVVGRGVKGLLLWRDSAMQLTSAVNSDTAYLLNATDIATGGQIYVDSIKITGAQSNDFVITSNSMGYPVVGSFPVAPDDTSWFVVQYHPGSSDTSRADVVAYDMTGYRPVLHLVGIHSGATVSQSGSAQMSVSQFANHLSVQLPTGSWNVSLFDALGRTLQAVTRAEHHTIMNLAGLPAGAYFVRISSRDGVPTQTFMIRR